MSAELSESWSDVRLNTDKLDRDIRKVTQRLQRAVRDWERKLRVEAELDLDTDRFERDLREVQAQVAKVRETIEANAVQMRVELDADQAKAAAAAAGEQIDRSVGDATTRVTAELDLDQFNAEWAALQARLHRLENTDITVDFDDDSLRSMRSRLDDLRADFDRILTAAPLDIDIDDDAFIERVANLAESIDAIELDVTGDTSGVDAEIEKARRRHSKTPVHIPIGGDDDPLQRTLKAVEARMRAMERTVRDIPLDVNARRALDNAARARAQIQSVWADTIHTDIDVNDVEARAKLAALTGRLAKLDHQTANIKVDVDGHLVSIAQLGAVEAARIAAGGKVEVKVDVDTARLSRITSTLGRATSFLGRSLLLNMGRLPRFGRSLQRTSIVATRALSGVGEMASNTLQAVGNAASKLGSKVADMASSVGDVAAKMAPKAAIILTIVTLIGGALALITGPALAAIGGIVGALLAMVAAAGAAAAAVGGLSALALMFDKGALDTAKNYLEAFKDDLVAAFEPVTDLIVTRILPAFMELGQRIIPIAAELADDFIVPIADSVLNLIDRLVPVIQQITGPMARGLASIIDTISRFAPTFGEISMAIGPPLTDALNAILEVLFTLGDVFKDDIGSAFQVIADLFREMQPMLTGFEGSLTPFIQLLADMVLTFVEAGSILGEMFGPQLSEAFRSLAANSDVFLDVLVWMGTSVTYLIIGFSELVGWVASLREAVAHGLGTVVQGVLGMLGSAVRGIGGVIANVADGILSVIEGIASAGSHLPDFLGGDVFQSVQVGVRGARDGIAAFRATTTAAGDSVENLGRMIGGASRFAADFSSVLRGMDMDALEEGRLSAESLGLEMESLNERFKTGKLSVEDYSAATDALVRSLEINRGKLNEQQKSLHGAMKAWEDFHTAILPGAEEPLPGMGAMETWQAVMNKTVPSLAEFINEDNKSVVKAINDRGKLLSDGLKASRDLVKLASKHNAPELADLLGDLTPDQIARAMGELKGMSGKQIRELNELVKDQMLAGNPTIEAAIDERGRVMEAAFNRVARTEFLQLAGFDPLAEWLEGLDDEAFAAAWRDLERAGEKGIRDLNKTIVEQNEKYGKLSHDEMARFGGKLGDSFGKGVSDNKPDIARLLGAGGADATGGGSAAVSDQFAPVISQAQTAGEKSAASFTDGLSTNLGDIDTSGVVAQVSGLVTELARYGTVAGTAFTSALNQALGGVGNDPATAQDPLVARFGRKSGVSATLFADVIDEVQTAAQTLLTEGLKAGAKFVDGLMLGVTAAVPLFVFRFAAVAANLAATAAVAFQAGGTRSGQVFTVAAGVAIMASSFVLAAMANLIGAQVGAQFSAGILPPVLAVGPLVAALLSASLLTALPVAAANGSLLGQVWSMAVVGFLAAVGTKVVVGTVINLVAAVARTARMWATTGTRLGVAFTQAAATAITRQTARIVAAARRAGTQAGTGFGSAAATAIRRVTSAITSAAASAGSAAGARFSAAARSGIGGLGPVFLAALNRAFAGLTAVSFRRGYDVGDAFGDGLARGMLDSLERTRRTAEIMANMIARTVRDALEIRSPSKVMAALGEAAGAGLADGLVAALPRVRGASAGLAAALPAQVAAAHERAVTYQRSTTTIDRSDRSTHTNHITMPTTDPFTAIRLMDRRVRRKNR